MEDLISRSDTMKRLRNYAEQKHYNGEVELANGILKAICFIEKEENIPTAYDLDKVVAELDALYFAGSINTVKKIYDIVKRGGRDERDTF